MLPWVLCALLFCTVIILLIKIILMRKSMTFICKDMKNLLEADTNMLISISTGDRYVRKLAKELNDTLISLRKQRRCYERGDKELKEAITNISHDLRTPLTAICGYLDLLEREEKSEATERYVEQIRNRAQALKALTEELFRYSVITSTPPLERRRINICRVLEESLVSFYGAMHSKGITPEITIPDKAIYKILDPSALSRIFGNIIGNAVKYSDGDLSVALKDDGTITFSNTASLLSTVEVGRLFDRFYTVDSAKHQTGLGLSIAKLLVERMNGNIGAEYVSDKLIITIRF